MLINFYEPEVTKELILSKLDPEEILSFYLGHAIKYDDFILSPIREERHPSFSFLRTKDTIIWSDWGDGKTGDFFTLLQIITNKTYFEVLKMIYDDLIANRVSTTKKLPKVSQIEEKLPKTRNITLEFQPFTSYDINYWKQFNITLTLLTKYNVKSVKRVKYIGQNSEIKENYYYNNNPIYYYGYSSTSYKLYKPLENKRYKWLFFGKATDLEGFDQLPWLGELLIITKSLKDVMTLTSLGYNAISLQGEGNKLNNRDFTNLKNRFNNIVSLYDSDTQGTKGAELLQSSYNIKPFFIPEEYGVKDISEFCCNYGGEHSQLFLKKMFEL